MGNDGGSIPTRRELVKEAARTPTASQIKECRAEQQHHHWTTDPITQQPLASPIVSDYTGALYNKESILEHLVGGGGGSAAPAHIRSLKDLVQVQFAGGDGDGDRNGDGSASNAWKCPVTNAVLGPGGVKAVYLVPCGHAFAAAAVREVAAAAATKGDEKAEQRCLRCEKECAEEDVIPILPTGEAERERLEARMRGLVERGRTHSLQKGGKRKRREKEVESKEVEDGKRKRGGGDDGGINNAAAAAVAEQVRREQSRTKKLKPASANVRSLFRGGESEGDAKGANADFMTRGYSVASRR